MITSTDVSILIPSYGNKDLTLKCLYSAILNNPGEIIISEDARDKTLESDIEKLNNPKKNSVTFNHTTTRHTNLCELVCICCIVA